jgi:D-3-phosphoglycerate dehydrogenase
MSKPKVLIADELAPEAVQIFKDRGVDVEVKVGLKPKELIEIIAGFDGLAVRSATKATADVIAAANNLKVIGRAGIGVDNIDIKAATARGICVMNTPFGNNITTAEHSVAMMMALARHIPLADRTTHDGKWEKSRFVGVELYAKVLGIVGCGNIGSIVADRAQGLKMKVIAFDPFLSAERAIDLGVEKVELETLLKRADFISLHTPLTDQTRGIINAEALFDNGAGAGIAEFHLHERAPVALGDLGEIVDGVEFVVPFDGDAAAKIDSLDAHDEFPVPSLKLQVGGIGV